MRSPATEFINKVQNFKNKVSKIKTFKTNIFNVNPFWFRLNFSFIYPYYIMGDFICSEYHQNCQLNCHLYTE